MRALIHDYPRQIAFPIRKLVNNETEFYKYLNKYNGIRSLYYSVYKPNAENKFSDIMIDKIFFDFDEPDAIEDVKKLSNYLFERDIQHLLFFSGKKGFHVYVFNINYEHLKSAKDSLTNAHDFFISQLNIKMDMHIRGDTARIARIPNSWHLLGKRYCIPLTRTDLSLGMDQIKEKAKKQNFNFVLYGKKLFDMKQFDFENGTHSAAVDIPDYQYEIKSEDLIIKKFLPCVQNWLMDAESGNWEARYYFAVYCKALCIPKQLCTELAKKYFSKMPRTDNLKNNFNHMKSVHAISYAYDKESGFPSCAKLFDKGLCKGKCKRYNKTGLYK